ncbi:hypothetical protein D1007_30218 [Hordeum vulgare]|nr:hypothetical protein D1007_30218 [Hordeum vulgare]
MLRAAPPVLRAAPLPDDDYIDDVDAYIYLDDDYIDGYIYIDDDGYIDVDVDGYDYIDDDNGVHGAGSIGMVRYIHGVRVRVHGVRHHLKIIHVKDDKVKPEANQWKTNDVQEGTTNGVQEGSGVISDDLEYNTKEDEVVVHKTVKALKTPSKKRKSSEASAAMPPRKVMAPPPGQTKRILERDEPNRVTRRKATMTAATDHQESLLGMDFESSVEMRDEFL